MFFFLHCVCDTSILCIVLLTVPTSITNVMRSLKTGLLKWRPEYDIACDEYQKAGKNILNNFFLTNGNLFLL